jgi:hypothetical protein
MIMLKQRNEFNLAVLVLLLLSLGELAVIAAVAGRRLKRAAIASACLIAMRICKRMCFGYYYVAISRSAAPLLGPPNSRGR